MVKILKEKHLYLDVYSIFRNLRHILSLIPFETERFLNLNRRITFLPIALFVLLTLFFSEGRIKKSWIFIFFTEILKLKPAWKETFFQLLALLKKEMSNQP